jgi:hypothetical protein
MGTDVIAAAANMLFTIVLRELFIAVSFVVEINKSRMRMLPLKRVLQQLSQSYLL